MKMCHKSLDGAWDIKVCEGALGYLCRDITLLSQGGIISAPGCDRAGNFTARRDTYYFLEEMVTDNRQHVKDSHLGYIVLRLPENNIAPYFVVSMRDGMVVFRNG
jgi:hypothetical protein